MTGRERLLRETLEAVRKRGEAYGPPAEHFRRTCEAAAALLPDLFRRPPKPSDWAKLMMIDKLARDAETPRLDSCVDLAGYAACLAEVRHHGAEVPDEPQAIWHGLEGCHDLEADAQP